MRLGNHFLGPGMFLAFLTAGLPMFGRAQIPPPRIESSEESPQRLQHAGRWLVDSQGRVVLIRGFNMINKLPPYTLSAAGFGEEDAEILRKEGFNGVRVGVIYSAVEPSPGKYDDHFLDDIEATVRMLERHGIGSLLDFHQDAWGPVFNGEGMPAWATLTDGLPTSPNPGFPAIYFELPALSRAFDNFWNNKPGPGGVGLQDRYAAAWAHVASRFVKVPGVLGYELMNEPFPGSAWPACKSAMGCPEFDKRLSAFNKKVGEAIRKHDNATLIFYEPNVLFDLPVPTHVTRPLADPQIGFAFHTYGNISRGLGMAEQYSAETDTALFATEWGATTDTALMRSMAKDMDEAMMSWLYWAWANKPPYKVIGGKELGNLAAGGQNHGVVYDLTQPRRSPNLHEDRLDALARPYPQAVAGIPVEFSFDPDTSVFSLTYSTQGVTGRGIAKGAHTEIIIPERQYRGGYQASVKGATVISRPGDRVLRLINQKDEPLVSVRVEPRKH